MQSEIHFLTLTLTLSRISYVLNQLYVVNPTDGQMAVSSSHEDLHATDRCCVSIVCYDGRLITYVRTTNEVDCSGA